MNEQFVELPWKDWYVTHTSMASSEADKVAVVDALPNIHEHYDVTRQPIEVLQF